MGILRTILLPFSVLLFPLSAAAQEADGQRLFQQRCATCHTIGPGQNKTGPQLLGIIGRAAGSVEGATYSEAMQSSGITWDRQSLDTFLAAPRQMIRGTRMTVSVPNAAQRAAIIDYLESQSPD
ncbi:c-type cytochrome [Agrobacterium sp. a22-2]|uniref:c-type cytochrome n=1 Tax=Agrobacterium sp. a22-2 TaxID=2283840 RepID=UPI0014485A4A|nr:c-type cytochrome [Agrobacterium sp. a22-2]NKN37325.1 c-type cytochrome [Agrobacterium sp. a22-2]